MSLSDAVKTDVRRFLNYPLKGLPAYAPIGSTGSTIAGYRLDPEYQNLEWRMNTMTPAEESRVTGFAYAAIGYSGNAPNSSDQITVTISGGGLGSPVSFQITAVAGDTQLTILNKIATAVVQSQSLVTLGFEAVSPWGVGVFSAQEVPNPQIQVTAPAAFTLTVAATGQIGAIVTDAGGLPPLNIPIGNNQFVYGYVPILNYLEGAVGGSTQNLDTSRAGEWYARGDEIGQRNKLERIWKVKLATFMGVPILKKNRSRMAII